MLGRWVGGSPGVSAGLFAGGKIARDNFSAASARAPTRLLSHVTWRSIGPGRESKAAGRFLAACGACRAPLHGYTHAARARGAPPPPHRRTAAPPHHYTVPPYHHTIIIPSSYHHHTIIIPSSYHHHTIIPSCHRVMVSWCLRAMVPSQVYPGIKVSKNDMVSFATRNTTFNVSAAPSSPPPPPPHSFRPPPPPTYCPPTDRLTD